MTSEETPGPGPATMADPSTAPDIRLVGLVKRFGDFAAVDHIDLEVAHGEFFTMLGPSGSGKTTTLRLIAGFDVPDEGRVELAGKDVARRPPFERDVNTVFQDYALFPHMSVLDNVAYGLKIKKVGRGERRTRAQEALEMVRLHDVGGRRPNQLSGGQRQRVALARAIVNRPRVLLLDEPLGALDLKLREEMQVELKQIQQDVAITFVYVTHDQDEALSMSDRIAVFNRGKIEQVGTPAEVYEHPANEFVAGFVGVSNVIEREGRRFTIRPEKVRILEDGDATDDLHVEDGTVVDASYVGQATRYAITLEQGGEIIVTRQNFETSHEEARMMSGRRVRVGWRQSQAYTIDTADKHPEEGA